MSEQIEEETDWLDKCNILYDFLLGIKLPEGFGGVKMPNLSPKKAFDIIYILQEAFHLLPDTIEQCSRCKKLFDRDLSGIYGGDKLDNDRKKKYHGKFFCDDCIPNDFWNEVNG